MYVYNDKNIYVYIIILKYLNDDENNVYFTQELFIF